MITAAVFDIGGVLEIVDDAHWPLQWFERWQAVGDAGDRLEETSDTAPGDMTESETREFYRSRFGLTAHQADAMMADMWDCYCGRLDARLRDFVAGLRPRFSTALLSNSADGARREEQRRYDFAGLVDTIVYSHEVGTAKPDAAIYELTAERLHARPEEIVFTDDSEAAVDGALAAGWQAVLHVDTVQSIRELAVIMGLGAGGGGGPHRS